MIESLIVYVFLTLVALGASVLVLIYFVNNRDKKQQEAEYHHHFDSPDDIYDFEFGQKRRLNKNSEITQQEVFDDYKEENEE